MSVFVATNNANSFAYETLVYLGQDGEIVPGLAESWEETPTSVTYTLKDGITCADGTPLTATTVADNFSFVADPANQSPLLGLYVPPGITVEADDAARTVTLTSEAAGPVLAPEHRRRLVHRVRRGLGRSQHPRRRHRRHRSVRARGGGRQRPLHVSAPGTTTRGGPTAPPASVPGFPSEVVLRDRRERVDGGQPAARPARSTPPRSPGPTVSASRARATSRVENRAIVGEFFFNQMEGLPTADVAVRQALMGALDLRS